MHIGKGTKAGQDLAARAERIIGLQDQQSDTKIKVKDLTKQIADEFADAASTGFNAKALREAIKRLRMTPDERQAAFDFEQELEVYCAALDALPQALQSKHAAEAVFNAMTDSEKAEASVRVAIGEDAVTAVTKAVRKRDRVRTIARSHGIGTDIADEVSA